MRPKPPGRRNWFASTPSRRASHRRVRLDVETLEDRLALTALPSGFTETLVTTGVNLSAPTGMTFSPTGQLWVLEQGGLVRFIRSDGTTPSTPAKTLTVDSRGERGLLGIAFDPSYDGAGPNADYVYLYYTVPRVQTVPPALPDPPNNQISRFPVINAGSNAPTLGNPDITRELPPEDEDNNLATDGDTNHNGGALHFGTDGKLYVAVGDHNYDPADQNQHPSQKKDTPFGKILRLNPNLTNPSDNPFYAGSTTDWQGAIWAMGLRNPFRFAVQPGTGTIFINDVGESTWEEINLGVPGANYGWAGSVSPLWEGFEPNPAGTPVPWENYHNPVMAYRHDSTSPGSTAITGGVFYPAGGQFGSAYAGKYFYSDLGGRNIRIFDPANPGTYVPGNPAASHPDTSSAFASDLTTGLPVDLAVDAAGNLYYLAIGGPGEIYRISSTGAAVMARNLFYNQSAFDAGNPAIGPLDDNAIAVDKSAYLPNGGPATFDSVSSYTRGINGIMIDLAGGGAHAAISASDFVFKVGNNNVPNSWAAAPAVSAISVRAGAGVGGSDRVEITWATGAIRNRWLEVQVLPTANTGLLSSDVFFFGNKVGDSGTDLLANEFQTNTTDAAQVFATLGPAAITNLRDYNRSGGVDTTDAAVVFASLGTINRIAVGPSGPFAPQGGFADSSLIASALAAMATEASGSSPPPPGEAAGRPRGVALNRAAATASLQPWTTEGTPPVRTPHDSDDAYFKPTNPDDEWLDELAADLALE